MEIWLGLLAIGVLIWWLARRPADFVIRKRRGHTEISGRLAAGHRAAIQQFVDNDLAGVGRLSVKVKYARGTQPLRIDVRGRVSAGDRQMIRNFLLAEL